MTVTKIDLLAGTEPSGGTGATSGKAPARPASHQRREEDAKKTSHRAGDGVGI